MVSDSLNPHQNPFIQSLKPAGGVSVIIQVWGQMGALWLSAALWLCSVTYTSTLALSSLWKLWKRLLVLWGSVSECCVIVVSINIINCSVQCDQYCDLTDHRLMEYCHRLGPFRWATQIWSLVARWPLPPTQCNDPWIINTALPFSHDHPSRSAQPSSSSQLLSSPPATSSSSLGSLADGQAYVRGCHHPSARPTPPSGAGRGWDHW